MHNICRIGALVVHGSKFPRAEYYEAFQGSTLQTDFALFISLMLRMILDAVTSTAPQASPQVREMLAVMRGEMDCEALQLALALSERKSFRQRYLKPALDGVAK